jgi:hypothetical protein
MTIRHSIMRQFKLPLQQQQQQQLEQQRAGTQWIRWRRRNSSFPAPTTSIRATTTRTTADPCYANCTSHCYNTEVVQQQLSALLMEMYTHEQLIGQCITFLPMVQLYCWGKQPQVVVPVVSNNGTATTTTATCNTENPTKIYSCKRRLNYIAVYHASSIDRPEETTTLTTATTTTEHTTTATINKDPYDIFLRSQPMTMAHATLCHTNFPVHKQPIICHYVVQLNQLELLQHLRTTLQCPWDTVSLCAEAAALGYLPILQWIRSQLSKEGRIGDGADGRLWDRLTCTRAAYHGHFHIVQWARINGCDWDATTCAAAAHHGHLPILQWIREYSCPWDDTTCANAAHNGHLHVVQWARENGCEWDEDTCTEAATNGHLHVLQWARSQDCPWDEWTCAGAAKNGHLHILQWARENGCKWNEDTCSNAAFNGHLEVLQWARNNDCPWDEWTCHDSAMNGHLHVLEWARSYDCPWNQFTCAYAAENGRLQVLKWARHNDCPWDEQTCWRAAMNGHLNIVKWAHRHGCPWDEHTVGFAKRFGHVEIEQWAYANGCPYDYDDTDKLRTATVGSDDDNFIQQEGTIFDKGNEDSYDSIVDIARKLRNRK